MSVRSKHFILGSSSSSSWSSSCCCCCFFFLSSLPSSSFYLHFLLLPFNCNEALFLYYSTKSHKNFLFSHLLQLNSWPPPLLGAQPPLLVVALLVRFFSQLSMGWDPPYSPITICLAVYRYYILLPLCVHNLIQG